MKVDELIFCGIDTSMCVETSLRDAFNLGFDVIVILDATASMCSNCYKCALDYVSSLYGLVRTLRRLLMNYLFRFFHLYQ